MFGAVYETTPCCVCAPSWNQLSNKKIFPQDSKPIVQLRVTLFLVRRQDSFFRKKIYTSSWGIFCFWSDKTRPHELVQGKSTRKCLPFQCFLGVHYTKSAKQGIQQLLLRSNRKQSRHLMLSADRWWAAATCVWTKSLQVSRWQCGAISKKLWNHPKLRDMPYFVDAPPLISNFDVHTVTAPHLMIDLFWLLNLFPIWPQKLAWSTENVSL